MGEEVGLVVGSSLGGDAPWEGKMESGGRYRKQASMGFPCEGRRVSSHTRASVDSIFVCIYFSLTHSCIYM